MSATKSSPTSAYCKKRTREEDLPWCLVESEPDIFTEMLHSYGAKDLKVEEVYDLDLMPSNTVYGLIFAKPCDDETLPPPIQSKDDEKDAEAVFFSCQIVTNICATLALLGILFNIDHYVCIGDHLTYLKDVLRYADPVLRGNAIGNDSLLRETHNSFADAQARASADEPPTKAHKGKKGKKKIVTEDAKMYHYVSFIPLNGYIWELDGFNKYPVKVGKATQEDWIEVAKPILLQRMIENEGVDFSLLSVIPGPWVNPNAATATSSRPSSLDLLDQEITTKLKSFAQEGESVHQQGYRQLPTLEDTDQSTIVSETIRLSSINGLLDLKRQLDEKRTHEKVESDTPPEECQIAARELAKTRLENTRRKHDYIPFVRTLFEKLHKNGLLQELLES